MMTKIWSDDAWEEFCYWESQDRKTLKRILKLIKDIDRNSYSGIGKPEKLKGDLNGGVKELMIIIDLFIKSKIIRC